MIVDVQVCLVSFYYQVWSERWYASRYLRIPPSIEISYQVYHGRWCAFHCFRARSGAVEIFLGQNLAGLAGYGLTFFLLPLA